MVVVVGITAVAQLKGKKRNSKKESPVRNVSEAQGHAGTCGGIVGDPQRLDEVVSVGG